MAALAAVATNSQATTGHALVGQIGGLGNGDGQFGEPLGNGPAGVGVMASTGEVFTVDAAQVNRLPEPRVQRFSADGVFQSAFALDRSYDGGVSSVAVADGGSGAVYVATGLNGGVPSVVKYTATGVSAGEVVYALDAAGSNTSINGSSQVAVDPVDGTVYVTATYTDPVDPSITKQVIDSFSPTTGAFVGFFDGASSLEGAFFCSASGLAVDGLHRVYVLDPCKSRVDRFEADGSSGVSVDVPLRADGTVETPLAVAADPASSEVYVAHTGPVGLQVTHFNPGGVGVVYTLDALEVDGVRGMAVSGAGTVYTSDAAKPFVQRFVRFDGPTVVTGDPPATPEPRSAALEGTINPEGVASSSRFEYGTDLTYGQRSPVVDAGSGSVAVSAAATVSGLQPNKTYHYRIVGSNGSGSIAGGDRTFRTAAAPVDVGGAFASEITPRGARLHGTVNSNNTGAICGSLLCATEFHFEYGTTAAYGSSTTVGFLCFFSSGDNCGDAPVAESLSGLSPATTYHFRIVADNGVGGPQFGADQTFVTAPAAGGGARSVTAGRATLTGTVNPHGLDTTYSFRYGVTSAYGASTPEMNAGNTDGEITVTAPVTGLVPGIQYHVQVVATSTYEEENPVTHEMETKTVTRYGADGNFLTAAAPSATALAPTSIGTSTATLVGDLNNHNASALYHFEVISDDGSFTLSTPVTLAGAFGSEQRVRTPVTGLPSGTTFTVELVAESNDAFGVSDPLSFETEPLPKSSKGNAFVYPPAPVEPGAGPSVKVMSGVFTAKVRMKASRTGMLPVKVSATSAGIVTLTVKAKFGKKAVRVGRISERVKAGVKTQVNVLLNSRARKRLRSGKSLRVTIAVRQLGARTRTTSILLPGVTS